MVKKQKLPKEYQLPKAFWVVLGAIVAIVVVGISWFLVWRTGWPAYIEAVSQCNGNAPIEATSFMSRTYSLPLDKEYKIPAGNTEVYFCSEQEAKDARYHRSVLN